jgi:hypothetical protein
VLLLGTVRSEGLEFNPQLAAELGEARRRTLHQRAHMLA